MSKKAEIKYSNNKKINEMIKKEKKMLKLGFTFSGLAIFSEISATIYEPNIILSGLTIANVIGLGVCASKVITIDAKIEHYIKTHQKK